MLDIQNLLGNSTVLKPNGTPDGIGMITPKNVVKDMVDLLPDDVWNKDTKFLDIACKSGNFLIEIYNRLINHPKLIEQLGDNIEYRREWILNNQLYGISMSEFDRVIATRNLYGYNTENSNIVYINNYIDNYIKSETGFKFFTDKLKETFGIMKFDVVIGNPPYNNDIYLDFVTKGHILSDKCCCMVTPAKWQAKTDGKPKGSKTKDKNEEFRNNIVPYMDKIVFYPDTRNIFEIAEWGGISYFTTSNNKKHEKIVKTICETSNIISSEFENHDEISPVLYNRSILSIIGKAGTLGEGFKQSLYVKNTDHGEETIAGTLGFKRQTFVGEQERGEVLRQAGYVEVMQGEKVCGYKKKSELFTQDNIDKYKIITSIIVSGNSDISKDGKFQRYFNAYYIKPNQVPKGSFPIIKYFDTEEECKSFISYTNTKLFKFLFSIGVCGTTITKEFFRFIPDPEKFDHMFTDVEIYNKYNLTEEEINIIESVIKERK